MATESVTLAILQTHGYWVLLLLLIFDGAVAALAGLAASLGIFNVYIVFALAILGGLIPDTLWFYLGQIGKQSVIDKYFGEKIKKYENSKLKRALEKNSFKTLFVIKFTPYMQIPGFILAGSSKMKYKKYISSLFIITSLHAFIFTFGGYYFGKAFLSLFGGKVIYLGFAIVGLMIIISLSAWAYRRFSAWAYKRIEEISKSRKNVGKKEKRK